MKAFVTGATGYVGQAVTRDLLAHSHQVRALIRKTSDTRYLEGLDVERACGDLRDVQSLRDGMRGCDTLFHVGAYVALWAPDPNDILDANVLGTRNILQVATELGYQKCVYTSSIATVGPNLDGTPADEEAIYRWEPEDTYLLSKYMGEMEALRAAVRGCPVVIVNPASCYGEFDYRPSLPGMLVLHFLCGRMKAYIDSTMNMIDVRDQARGHVLAAERGRIGERYLIGNENLSVRDACRLLSEITGIPAPTRRIPIRVAMLLGLIAELRAQYVTKKPPSMNHAAIKMGRFHIAYDCSKAVRELGLELHPVRGGLERAVEWFMNNGFVPEKYQRIYRAHRAKLDAAPVKAAA
ncbi:MAG: NAD-dependent epimerase/dehydratase family protein [Candidatus Binatia bacterium]